MDPTQKQFSVEGPGACTIKLYGLLFYGKGEKLQPLVSMDAKRKTEKGLLGSTDDAKTCTQKQVFALGLGTQNLLFLRRWRTRGGPGGYSN